MAGHINDNRYENNSNSPWSYTNFQGMRLATIMIWMEPQWFTLAERYLLITLYGALVKDTDIIDRRVTQQRLAEHCGVNLKTVRRAYQTFFKYNLIRPLDEDARHYLLRVPLEDLERIIHERLEHHRY